MRPHRTIVVVVALLAFAASCSDDGPGFPTGSKYWVVDFERITLASDTPDRVEIEIVVHTGASLAEAAPDGTVVVVTASTGGFQDGSGETRVPTSDGHALVTLMLPPERPVESSVTARVDTAQVTMSILVDQAGSMRLGV
jgi:hypothetical protein